MTATEISGFFEKRFHNVDYVGIQTLGGIRFANVTFKSRQSAVAAASKSYYEIGRHRVNVSIAEHYKEETNFLAINDYCFIEIFRHAAMKDSYSLSRTCERLRALLHSRFPEIYKNRDVILSQADDKVMDIIQEYGYMMESIRLRCSLNSNRPLSGTSLLTELKLFCPKLSSLEMVDYTFCNMRSTRWTLAPLFERLRTFKLKNGSVSDKLLPVFNVEHLVLMGIQIIKDKGDAKFMSRLRTLKLKEHPHVPLGPCFLRLIREPSPVEHLEVDDITIDEIENWNREISNYRNLKKLYWFSNGVIMHDEVAMAASLIQELPLLTDLVLGYPLVLTPPVLLRLIEAGQNLDQLVIICNYKYNKRFPIKLQANRFNKMWDAVSRRPNLKRLNVIVVGNQQQIVPFIYNYPAGASIKITCLLASGITEILGVDRKDYIRMTDRQIAVLQDKGLLK